MSRSLLRQAVLALLCLSVPAQASADVLKLIIPAVLVKPKASLPRWRTSQQISSDGSNAWMPEIAMDTSGNAIAVWSQSDGIKYSLWASRYVPGTGWETAQLIETGAGNAEHPKVAFDTTGNAIAVWQQSDNNSFFNIWSNRYVPSSGWGTAQLIETDNMGNAEHPKVAFDTTGNAIAVWQQSDGTRFNIWANRYVPSSGWGAAEIIETDNAGHANFPQIAMDTAGNAIAVWQQSDGTVTSIISNRYEVGKGWGPAQCIETGIRDAHDPQVTIDASGNAVAIWSQTDCNPSGWTIRTNRYIPEIGWGLVQELVPDDAGPFAWYPQIAVDAVGNTIAIWQQSRSSIWISHYTAGQSWGSVQLIHSAAYAEFPQIVVNPTGRAIAVWWQRNGTRDSIWAARFE